MGGENAKQNPLFSFPGISGLWKLWTRAPFSAPCDVYESPNTTLSWVFPICPILFAALQEFGCIQPRENCKRNGRGLLQTLGLWDFYLLKSNRKPAVLGKKGEVQSYLTLVGLRSPNFAITVGNSGALSWSWVCLTKQNCSASSTLLCLCHKPCTHFITQGKGTSFLLGKSLTWKTDSVLCSLKGR